MNINKNYEYRTTNNTDIHKSTQIYTSQHRYTQVNTDIHKTTQIYFSIISPEQY
jgi:hypothetical protein